MDAIADTLLVSLPEHIVRVCVHDDSIELGISVGEVVHVP